MKLVRILVPASLVAVVIYVVVAAATTDTGPTVFGTLRVAGITIVIATSVYAVMTVLGKRLRRQHKA
jgi:hypothetical protein